MLSCRQVTSLASDYLDGALPGRTRFAVRLHLLMCWMCRRYVRQLELTTKVLRRLAGDGQTAATPAPLKDAFRSWKADRDRPDTKTP
jgi:predicted anti-sigma-YlaC factor YlaD